MAVAAVTNRNRQDVLFDLNRSMWNLVAVRSHELPLNFKLDEEFTLTVHGHTPTQAIKDEILSVAASIDGVAEVRDQVVADPDLEIAIAEALARDDRTRNLPPGTISIFGNLGNVVLVGEVADPDRDRIVQVASGVDGVRGVTDRLQAAD
jgi:osmotically-inducible protein OsmY